MEEEENFRTGRGAKEKKSRTELIRHSWASLKEESALSLKEKLERLLALAREAKNQHGAMAHLKVDEKREWEKEAGISGFRLFENSFSLNHAYGKVKIGSGLEVKGNVLVLLSREAAFEELDLSSALFIDLETTGLSGGVGVIPFLIGLAFYQEGTFKIRQFFLNEPSEEQNMILELNSFLQSIPFRSIISFNGKGFDLPILETRFTLSRLSFPLADLPHLDFIFPARKLWKQKHESCRLCHLAQQVLGASRWEDIPSSEVPMRYFAYLRHGNFSLIEPVLEHNQQDLLSLLGIIISASELISEAFLAEEEVNGFDLIGLARLLESAGEVERSLELMEKALEQNVPEAIALGVKKKLAWYWKRNRRWERAVALWEELALSGRLACFRELAIYYEHRRHDYERARQLAAEGLSIARGVSKSYEEDFGRRLQRLEEKIKRGKIIRPE